MQLIRCTAKLQKEMGLKKSDLVETEPPFSYLGSWHANLIHIDGRKCILFANDKTLFNFIVPDVARADIKKLDVLFRQYLRCVLIEEDIDTTNIERIMNEYDEIAYAKTDSKSVLGSINDLAFNYKYHIQAEGGVLGCSVPGVIRRMNRMPMGAIKYCQAIEALKAMYKNVAGSSS